MERAPVSVTASTFVLAPSGAGTAGTDPSSVPPDFLALALALVLSFLAPVAVAALVIAHDGNDARETTGATASGTIHYRRTDRDASDGSETTRNGGDRSTHARRGERAHPDRSDR